MWDNLSAKVVPRSVPLLANPLKLFDRRNSPPGTTFFQISIIANATFGGVRNFGCDRCVTDLHESCVNAGILPVLACRKPVGFASAKRRTPWAI